MTPLWRLLLLFTCCHPLLWMAISNKPRTTPRFSPSINPQQWRQPAASLPLGSHKSSRV